MIENATNLTNATNITTQSEVTAMGYIINWLKTFFLETWVGNFLLFILVLATIGGVIVTTCISLWIRKRKRFQEIYKKWLEPNVIEFKFDNEGFRCPQQNDQEWAMFFKVVNWSMHYVIKGQFLYKKTEKAADSYNMLYKQVNTELTPIVTQIIDKSDLDLSIRDGGDYDPLESIMPKENIVYGIIDIVTSKLYRENKYKLHIKPISGGFVLYGGTWELAKSYSEGKLKKLMSLLQPLVENTVVKGKVKDIIEAEQKAITAKDSYNKVLAKTIRGLRF